MGALVLAHADEAPAAIDVAENEVPVETAAKNEGAFQVDSAAGPAACTGVGAL